MRRKKKIKWYIQEKGKFHKIPSESWDTATLKQNKKNLKKKKKPCQEETFRGLNNPPEK